MHFFGDRDIQLEMKRVIVFLLLCCILCVSAFAYRDTGISDVFCGNDNVFVLMDDGKLIAWGDNSSSQIPSAASRGTIKFADRRLITTNAKSLVLGPKCAFFIDSSNTLYGWGEDGRSSLLCGYISGGKTTEPVKLLEGIAFVSCGNEHNAAIGLDGTLYSWGMDTAGSLGLSLKSGSVISEPQSVLNNISAVCCHENSTLAITRSGRLYGWGELFGFSYPKYLASDICDVRRGGGNAFIILNSNNEVALVQSVSSEDGAPAVEITAPIASNISEICDYGYIRDDRMLWMCRSNDGNSFAPVMENVSHISCYDMRFRVFLAYNILHTESYEFDGFKNPRIIKGNDIDIPIEPKSDGVIGAVILGLIIAVPVVIIAGKPKFRRRIKEAFIASFEEENENS